MATSRCATETCRSVIRFLLFFFSSRRRHTRLQGDWSSDVCSSDLGDEAGRAAAGVAGAAAGAGAEPAVDVGSEERRVGKESGCRGGRGEEKKRRRGRRVGVIDVVAQETGG